MEELELERTTVVMLAWIGWHDCLSDGRCAWGMTMNMYNAYRIFSSYLYIFR